MSAVADIGAAVGPDHLAHAVAAAVGNGGRFAGVAASGTQGSGARLRALVTNGQRIEVVQSFLPPGQDRYPALTPLVPGAFWYEREIHDLFGLVPVGHPRLDPLVFPVGDDPAGNRPRPGRADSLDRVDPDTSALPGHVSGEGVFTIPYGPVRSGIFEAVEYLVETFGEDIPQLRVRPYVKHRGMSRRFTGLDPADGVLLAERVEGTLSVAHAMAFSQAVETLGGAEPPPAAEAQRMVHAELERIANHLDSMIRHTEGAGQAVAYARLTVHKEHILRLQARLCGHRFARGVVVPGGTTGPPLIAPGEADHMVDRIEGALRRDLRALMVTPSFLDRLRTTGPLPPAVAAAHGALGPVGRGSGTGDDVRVTRPYGAYRRHSPQPAGPQATGDALARQWIRVGEITSSWQLIHHGLHELGRRPDGPWRVPLPRVDGSSVGWVEAPQGELLYLIDMVDDRVSAAKPRTASFHNFALFSQSFRGDIFTDFVFLEASFGVSMAGVSG